MKLGIIRETKTPPDSRVPLSPQQCKHIQQNYPHIHIFVQPSASRCFSDQEYIDQGITLKEDLSQCDILMGVKEVKIDQLIEDKTYFFFSHTIKEQEYNRKLLQTILHKKIRLIDYEVLTNDKGQRLIAFGRFAGMVGAHNGVWAYGKRSELFSLKRMKDCRDYLEAKTIYKNLMLPPIKVVLTGTGRVSQGAAQVLKNMKIKQVSPQAFLTEKFDTAVFTQLSSLDYARRKDGKAFSKKEFYENPSDFESNFLNYTKQADIFINGIYWDNEAPAFFELEDLKSPEFKIDVIADVTCDIAPKASIVTTLKASTIADPLFGVHRVDHIECDALDPKAICMMTIDNLPNELPRDASESFGKQFVEFILDDIQDTSSALLDRATIAKDGHLGAHFQYLQEYVSKI